MNRQDLSGARTAQDLERKYNFEEIKRNVEKVKKNSEDINSINKDLQDFAKNITKDLGELQDQVDGNITTWFYKGVPTLSNYPANEWTTTEDRNNHLGDLYYDQDTGYSYRFTMLKSVFQWVKLTDSDITEALAVANAAQDTADKKRRVFLEQPKPPYDSGDMWIKDKEIWICQVSRAEGTYQTGDFINNLKYTDDTYAKGVNDDLIIVKGTVTKTRQDVDSLQTTMTSTVEALNTQGEKIGTLETKQSNITQTVEGIDARVTRNTNSINNINTPIKDLSGSTIHLEDGANAPLVKLEVDGKTEQTTREGYNLISTNNWLNITNDTPVLSNTNNTITYKDAYGVFKDYNIPSGTYHINMEFLGDSISNQNAQIVVKLEDNTNINISNNSNFTINNKKVIRIFIYKGNKNSNITIKNLIITSEANKNKPYQPYGVMPSPDYPSEIQNVGYENLFDKEKVASSNLNNWNVEQITNGIKIVHKNQYSDGTPEINLVLNPNTNYYLKAKLGDSNSSQAGISIYLNGTYNSFYNLKNDDNIKFATDNTGKVSLKFSASTNAYNEILNIQLNKKLIPYIPYGKYGLDITNVGLNIMNSPIIQGDLKFSDGEIYNNNSRVLTEKFIKIEQNSTYKVNCIGASDFSVFYYKNGEYFKKHSQWQSINTTFTVPSNYNQIKLVFGNINTGVPITSSKISNIMLYKGIDEKPYEPYQAYNTQIILPTQLAEQDKLIKQNGTWGIEKNINKIIFNGSENWQFNQGNYTKFFRFYTDELKMDTPALCNYYKQSIYLTSPMEKGVFQITGSNISFAAPDNTFDNVEKWKQWLKSKYDSGNPVIVQYELASPTFTPLDQVEQDKLNKIGTFKGVNNISTTDELEPNMNITYVRDTNISNYVSEQLGELSVSNNQIKASVKEIGTNLDTNTQQLNQVQNTITSQNQTIEIISKNIDRTNGNIKEVTTTNGFTFNNKGLNIYTDENSYNTQIDNVGTYYRDGNAVIAQTTKDGSLMKDLSEQGQHRYSYDTTDSTYNLIDETIEVNGEIGYATFWNGED